jgi:hypothetical protein
VYVVIVGLFSGNLMFMFTNSLDKIRFQSLRHRPARRASRIQNHGETPHGQCQSCAYHVLSFIFRYASTHPSPLIGNLMAQNPNRMQGRWRTLERHRSQERPRQYDVYAPGQWVVLRYRT